MKYWRVTDGMGGHSIVCARMFSVDEHNNLIFTGSDSDDHSWDQIGTVHKHDWRGVTEWDLEAGKPKWEVEMEQRAEAEVGPLMTIENYIDYEVMKRLEELQQNEQDT